MTEQGKRQPKDGKWNSFKRQLRFWEVLGNRGGEEDRSPEGIRSRNRFPAFFGEGFPPLALRLLPRPDRPDRKGTKYYQPYSEEIALYLFRVDSLKPQYSAWELYGNGLASYVPPPEPPHLGDRAIYWQEQLGREPGLTKVVADLSKPEKHTDHGVESEMQVMRRQIPRNSDTIRNELGGNSETLPDDHTDKDYHVEWGTGFVDIAQLRHAAELLRSGNNPANNRFIADAIGFAGNIIEYIATMQVPDEYTQNSREFLTILADHALSNNNVALAQYLFDTFDTADKWFMYAKAYESASMDPQLLSTWMHALESERGKQEQEADPRVSAARYIAIAQIFSHKYQGTTDPGMKNLYKGLAIEAAELFIADIKTPEKRFELKIDVDEALAFSERLSTSFGNAGLWEQAALMDPTLIRSAIWGKRNLDEHWTAYKALAGEAHTYDLLLLARKGDSDFIKILTYIDSRRQFLKTEPPVLDKPRFINYRALFDKYAPREMHELGVSASHHFTGLIAALAAGDVDAALNRYYKGTASAWPGTDFMKMALIMSDYARHNPKINEPADRTYEVFGHTIASLELDITAEERAHGKINDTESFMDRLGELYRQTENITFPHLALIARARLSKLHFRVSPDSPATTEVVNRVISGWTNIERHEGMIDTAPLVAEQLIAMGYNLVPIWKTQQVKVGYFGYIPIPQFIHRSETELQKETIERSSPEELGDYLQAAAFLNKMHQEERYVVTPYSYPLSDEPSDSQTANTVFGLTLTGTWQKLGGTYELENCADMFAYYRETGSLTIPTDQRKSELLHTTLSPILEATSAATPSADTDSSLDPEASGPESQVVPDNAEPAVSQPEPTQNVRQTPSTVPTHRTGDPERPAPEFQKAEHLGSENHDHTANEQNQVQSPIGDRIESGRQDDGTPVSETTLTEAPAKTSHPDLAERPEQTSSATPIPGSGDPDRQAPEQQLAEPARASQQRDPAERLEAIQPHRIFAADSENTVPSGVGTPVRATPPEQDTGPRTGQSVASPASPPAGDKREPTERRVVIPAIPDTGRQEEALPAENTPANQHAVPTQVRGQTFAAPVPERNVPDQQAEIPQDVAFPKVQEPDDPAEKLRNVSRERIIPDNSGYGAEPLKPSQKAPIIE